jgi:malate dehydrogenase (oxaloacetate-decarboxylating)(NADP+)
MRPVFMGAKANRAQAHCLRRRAKKSACCAPPRSWWTKVWPKPILVGRPDIIPPASSVRACACIPGVNCEIVNPAKDERFKQYYEAYHKLKARDGISPDLAEGGGAPLQLADCHPDGQNGRCRRHDLRPVIGRYDFHLEHIRDVIGVRKPEGAHGLAALNALILDNHNLFIADTFVNEDPTAEQLADIAAMAVEEVQRFGLPPRVAFLSHSMFGSSTPPVGPQDAPGP